MGASDFNGIDINIMVKNNAIDKKSKPGGCLQCLGSTSYSAQPSSLWVELGWIGCDN